MTANIDYNGTGRWSAEEILARHDRWVHRMKVATPHPLEIRITGSEAEGGHRVWPLMEQVIDGIDAGDLACVQLGVELLEEDQGFPFGAILKSNTARRLARCRVLRDDQRARLRERIVGLFETGIVPREFRAYSRLLRRIGFGDHWPRIVAAVPRNRHAERARRYFLEHCASLRLVR